MDRDTIMRRAAKLAALAGNNPNMAEAESASAALAALLTEYLLSMQDVTAAQMKSSIKEEVRRSDWTRIPTWANVLHGSIAKACNCIPITRGSWHGMMVSFIGEQADAAVAAYWYEVMVRLLPEIADRNRRSIEAEHWRVYDIARWMGRPIPSKDYRELRPSFLMGAAMRIGERLTEKLTPPPGPEGEKGRGLILVKDQAVREWVEHAFPNLKHRDMKPNLDHAMVRAGRAAAEGVELHDGIPTTAGSVPAIA